MKYLTNFIAVLLLIFTSCKKSDNPPNIEPTTPSESIDTSFWASDDVIRYEGNFIRFDSIVVGGTYPDHELGLHTIDTSVRMYRKRIVGNMVYLTFDPLALNTTITFSINDSLPDGWYKLNDSHQYKFSGDSLFAQSKFDYKDYIDRKWHYIESKFQGVAIN